jgi:hypothetical protein
MNPEDVNSLDLQDQSEVELHLNGHVSRVAYETCEDVPPGTALLPRSMGIPISTPVYVDLQPVE